MSVVEKGRLEASGGIAYIGSDKADYLYCHIMTVIHDLSIFGYCIPPQYDEPDSVPIKRKAVDRAEIEWYYEEAIIDSSYGNKGNNFIRIKIPKGGKIVYEYEITEGDIRITEYKKMKK
jgi:hypothetical protein